MAANVVESVNVDMVIWMSQRELGQDTQFSCNLGNGI